MEYFNQLIRCGKKKVKLLVIWFFLESGNSKSFLLEKENRFKFFEINIGSTKYFTSLIKKVFREKLDNDASL